MTMIVIVFRLKGLHVKRMEALHEFQNLHQLQKMVRLESLIFFLKDGHVLCLCVLETASICAWSFLRQSEL